MDNRCKGELRLLTFMLRSRTAEISAFEGEKRMLMAADKSRTLIASTTVQTLERAGLLASQGSTIRLTDVGIAAAKRAVEPGDSPFAAQHRASKSTQVVMESGALQSAQLNTEESPLARLATRAGRNGQPYISASEFEAGERLRRDFERAQMRQRVTASWDVGAKRGKGSAGGMADLSDTALDARTRLHEALGALGPDLAGVLEDVCCHLKGVETVERERRWPARSAKLMLRTGLSLLARHYGTTAGDGRRAVRTRHWKA